MFTDTDPEQVKLKNLIETLILGHTVQWSNVTLPQKTVLATLNALSLTYRATQTTLNLVDKPSVTLLDHNVCLNHVNLKRLRHLIVTNSTLQHMDDLPHFSLCVAEFQSHGHGRRQQQWVSTFAENLICTIKLPIPQDTNNITLKTAIAITHALRPLLPSYSVGIKYPNDIYANKQKLGGILAHIKHDDLLISFGININMTDGAIDQPWTSLSLLTGQYYDRSQLLNRILTVLLEELNTESVDFKRLNSYDICVNQPVYLAHQPDCIGIGLGFVSRGTYQVQFETSLYELGPNEQLRLHYDPKSLSKIT